MLPKDDFFGVGMQTTDEISIAFMESAGLVMTELTPDKTNITLASLSGTDIVDRFEKIIKVARNIKHEDTTCVMKVTAEPENIEQYGFQIEFNYPIIYENFDSLKLISINPRQQESKMKFSVVRDTLNLRKYTLTPEGKLMTGYEYKLKVPHRKFRDINGFYNDSTEVKVSLPKDDKLSTLILDMTNVNHKYIIDLLNEKRDKVLRSYIIEKDAKLTFPYLKEGKYSVRMTEDKNKNGMVDTGNLLEHRQPEKVIFYKLKDGSYILNIKEATEVEQRLDIAKLFGEN